MKNFLLLLNPDFFIGVSGPAQKAVLVPFFWGGVYDLFVFPTFLSPGNFSGGVFGAQNSKI
jgi:hypothetical protein